MNSQEFKRALVVEMDIHYSALMIVDFNFQHMFNDVLKGVNRGHISNTLPSSGAELIENGCHSNAAKSGTWRNT